MKVKRRRASEVPPKIRALINSVVSTPLESIQESLRNFVWNFDKGDFHHWVDLFNHFDAYFEKFVKLRKDLCLEDDFLDNDPPFPKEAVLRILRVMRIILENCSNKHLFSSYEHLSSLLASADADVIEASIYTLATFLKKTVGKYSIKDVSFTSRLFSFVQGWGCKEDGLELSSCVLENGCDSIAHQLGCTLHFEFYSVDESSGKCEANQGLQIIHVFDINSRLESDLELLNILVKEYRVPPSLRFTLFTRLRFARAFSSLTSRQQYTCIRLYAFVVVIQASSDADELVSFFNTEPEFVNELVSLLSFEDVIPNKIRILSLRALVALCQDRSRQPTVLAAVTSGGRRGILSSLMQKAIDSVIKSSSKWSVFFAEALLSLVTVLVSSSSGCSAMREAGFIPTLLPLLKDTDPQHLHLVATTVHVLEVFMDYSNPAAALFRDLGGLDDTIHRLKVEVSVIENGSKLPSGHEGSRMDSDLNVGAPLIDDMESVYSEALLSYHRRLLMKALLHAISLGTYAPGSTARIYVSEESLLPQCLCIIFHQAKDFGGGVFSLAATVMSDLIHKDPTCFSVLDAAGLPSAFLDAITDGVLYSAEAITCIPQCLDALCLNNNGLQAVKDCNALNCFVKIFTSRAYLRALAGDAPGSLSSGLDELMRHASTLRGPGVDMLIEILNTILKVGSAGKASPSSSSSLSCPIPVPMETDSESSSSSPVESELLKTQSADPNDLSSDAVPVNVESYLPEYVCNAARLLETILQNSDVCCLFIEKRGIEAVLQMFLLPLLPLSVSVGQNISIAFKNFSAQHSASLAKALCSFMRGHLTTTIELLDSIRGTRLADVEASEQTKVLRCLSSLEGFLSLSNSLLKGSTTVVSELGAGDADVLKDIGRVYREVLWQISLFCDSKVDEKKNVDTETEKADAAPSSASGRDSDDDSSTPLVRYMNPFTIRSGSHSQWSGERGFLSVIQAGEGLSRRNRHGLTRMRGGRTGRHLDVFNMDAELPANSHEPSTIEQKKKSPDILAFDILSKLSATLRSFFTALIKGFSSPNRRRADAGLLSSVAKNIGTALAKLFAEALNFSGHPSPTEVDISLSVKCRYLGKVVHDMAALTFDSRRRICYTAMVNNFYASGTLKELLTTFEATSQLLWTLPPSIPTDRGKVGEGSKLEHTSWLLDTLLSYCHLVEYFVNSSLLLSMASPSQTQLLVQPVAVGLSIGLFPVPRDPEVFVRMLQSQVLDVVLPVWNHPMFPYCGSAFIASVLALVNHIYCGAGDVKGNRNGVTGSSNQRVVPPPDETTIATIVEMGFSRARAEEALRRVESNSVEMAMDWLCTHAEDPVQEDDELTQALALSLGSSNETTKADNIDKSAVVLGEEGQVKVPPVDDILGSSMKLFCSGDSLAFPLNDLLVTLSNRNKGEDCPKVVSYLIQQLKVCSSDLVKNVGAVSSISHILALLLSEDAGARQIASQSGIVTMATDILRNFKSSSQLGKDVLTTKSTSALLLILDNLLQCRPRISTPGVASTGPLDDSSGDHASVIAPEHNSEKELTSGGDESGFMFEKIFGKSTGYLSMKESCAVLEIACDMLKQHVPAVILQAVLQLCARLTKTHALSLQYIESGGMAALFDLPRSCFFPGYDTLASAIIRHLLEDPQTLQTAMELEIRQTLSGTRHAGRVPVRIFLTSMAPVITRDPVIFTKAAAAVCQLESSAGRAVVLSKDKEKEKDRSKMSAADPGLSSNDSIRIPEIKVQDGSAKGPKGHKRIPANLAHVIDQLLEIILQFPSAICEEDGSSFSTDMEIDAPTAKQKGKSKIDETNKVEADPLPEKSAALAKVAFVLKLLSDILLMYLHAVSVVLKRDSEICQLRDSSQLDTYCSGQGVVVHHVLHKLLSLKDNSGGQSELREKLSEKASWFLVVLCGRSSEGRRRVISELVKALSMYSNIDKYSATSSLLPDKKVLAIVELVYTVLSKNPSSSGLSVSGYSPDIARSMIDGGIVPCLTNILQKIDLDHPDAPKIANLILKTLESLTRAANAREQPYKSDALDKKKSTDSQERSLHQISPASANQNSEPDDSTASEQEGRDHAVIEPNHTEGECCTENHEIGAPRTGVQGVRVEEDRTMVTNPLAEFGLEFTRGEIEDGDMMHDSDRIDIEFRVESQADEDIGDEDDDMGGEGEEEEDEDDGEDEDEDIAEDGTVLMSLAETDVDDHDDTGLGDDYNDEMIDDDDDDDDDYHENRVIEVRWREALDGFDQLQVAQSASGLIDIASEPFEGVNVDDLFGLRRSLGFERRRQTTRSLERTNTDGGLQHPLLMRPSQSGNGSWLSGGNMIRDSESLSGGSIDLSHLYMFDAPALPYDFGADSVFGDRSSGAAHPPLTDYSVGMGSLQLSGQRGPGDGRWADDGQPQAGNQASVIAQAVEEEFVSLLRGMDASNIPNETQSQNIKPQEPQSEALQNMESLSGMEGDNSGEQRREQGNGGESELQQNDAQDAVINVPNHVNITEEPADYVREDELLSSNPEQNSMEVGDGSSYGELMRTAEEPLPSSSDAENNSRNGGLAQVDDIHDEQMGGSENVSPGVGIECRNNSVIDPEEGIANQAEGHPTSVSDADDVEMNGTITNAETVQTNQLMPSSVSNEPSLDQTVPVSQDTMESDRNGADDEAPGPSAIDPTFLEALPEDLRAEVLASQQSQAVQPPTYTPPSMEDIDPEFLAALPPDIQAEVLSQQRAQRLVQQSEGQPVDMDNASIIATFPADLREEVLLTSSEAVLSALPSPLLAEAQMLRDRTMSHYQAHSLFGGSHRFTSGRNGLGFDRQSLRDHGVGVTIGRRTGSSLPDILKVKDVEGKPLLDAGALRALIRLLRLAQPLSKGLLQRLLLNLCAHSITRETLVRLLLEMIKPEAEGSAGDFSRFNPQRLYGCPSNVVYGQSQLLDGLPPLVLHRVLELLTYLATNHSAVANVLFYLEPSLLPVSSLKYSGAKNGKGKEKVGESGVLSEYNGYSEDKNIPLILLLKLLKRPLFRRSVAHVEQVMGLLQIVIYTAASRLESLSLPDLVLDDPQNLYTKASDEVKSENDLKTESKEQNKAENGESLISDKTRGREIYNVLKRLPESDLRNLCLLLGYERLSDKVYMLACEVLKKLASITVSHRKFFTLELSELVQNLSSVASSELITLKKTHMMGLSAGSMSGAAMLRILQALSSLVSLGVDNISGQECNEEEQAVMLKLNASLEPLWEELSGCIRTAALELGQSSLSPIMATMNAGDDIAGSSHSFPPLLPGTQRLLPFIESFFVLCEKLQSNNSFLQQDQVNVTATEVKELTSSSSSVTIKCVGESQKRVDSAIIFSRFADKHRRLLNAFIRQNPGLLEKSLSMMLKAPRLIEFDNKRAYFRSRIRKQHEQHLAGSLRISVRRAYVLEDSYNQLRMRSSQDLKGRLNVQFQGEEGIDAGGLTREWYQLLSRVIFDKGALLFTTVGSHATFQPNPNSVYQTEHLSYFKFVGRVVAKALFDGQLLDVYFTRSFYKHILGVKVTYHDIEAVDPDYYKNLKWMLENDISDILDLTFSMDADEEKHILYEKTEVTDYELKPGGRNIRVTEETKHEYVDLVADHILTNAIRPQINSFLEGFNELIPRELISIFNDKELELLISGLPEIYLDDLKANTEYTGYTAASSVVQWFWEVVSSFSKEDLARLLQFVTGTSKIPLEGFNALQGISGPQRFQIHKAYGAPERLPSAHTCFNQLDLPDYSSKEQLRERLLLAIHEASEGFGFG